MGKYGATVTIMMKKAKSSNVFYQFVNIIIILMIMR